MAVSEFLLNINWAFNLSRQSRQTMKDAKLRVEDINEGVKKYNDLSEASKSASKNMAASIVGSVNGIGDSFRNLNLSMSGDMAKILEDFKTWREWGYTVKEAIGEMKSEYKDFSIHAILEAKKIENANNKFAVSLADIQDKFYELNKTMFSVGKGSTDLSNTLRNQIAENMAFEKLSASMNTASEALNKFQKMGVYLNPEEVEQFREKFVSINEELVKHPQKLEEIDKAIKNIDFSNMSPKQIEKMTDLTGKFHKAIQDDGSAKEIAAIARELNRTKEGFDKNAAAVQKFKNEMSGFWQMLKGPVFRLIALGAVLEDSMSAQTEATRDIAMLNIRSSQAIARNQEGLFKTQMAYNKAMVDAGAATGSSLSRVQSTMNSLARLRVSDTADELGQLAEIGLQMEYAFGLSEGASAELLKSMKLIGGMGTNEIRSSMDALAGVQDSMGLTTEATREVAATIGTVIRQMNALGGATDVTAVTREIGKMTSAFESVGLSAQDASQMINKLMDPDQLANNTLLLNKMGMTAQDALAMMSGDGSQMAGMTRQMVGVAKDLKAQYGGNIYALKAMAEAHGMNLSQVQQLSQYDEERLNSMSKERDLAEQAAQSRAGMNEALKQLGAQLNILMAQFILPMINALSWALKPVVFIVQKMNELEGPLGKTLKSFSGIAVMILAIAGPRVLGMLIKGLFSSLSIVTKLGGGFGMVAGKIGTMTTSLGGLVGGPFKKLGEMSSKIFNKSQSAIDSAAGAASKGTGTLTKRIQSFGRAIRSIPAKQILAIGAAMLMIGGAIALVVMSIAHLVQVVGESNVVFTQLAGIAIILGVVMAGMVAMLYALGTAAAASAIPLLAAGLAMLMIGGAVSIIVLSLSHLIATVAESGATFSQLAGATLLLIPVMAGLAASLWLTAPAVAALGVATAASVGPILAFGAAILLMGLGIGIIVVSVSLLVSQIAKLGGEQVLAAAEGLTQISYALLNIAAAALAFGAAVFVFAQAMTILAASATAGLVAAVALTALVGVFYLAGKASNNLSENIMGIGTGMKMMSENTGGAKASLQELKQAMSGFEVPEGFNKLGLAFMILGITAKTFGQDILLLGTGVLHLGNGMDKINNNASNMSDSVSSVKSGLNGLMDMDLSLLVSTFQVLGDATDKVAKNFSLMGEGVGIMSQGLGVVVQQLENMIGVLSNNNLVGLSDNFNTEMSKINNSLRPSMSASPEVQAIAEMGGQRAESIRSAEGGGMATGAVVSELQVANTHLESMDTNIQNILNFMKDNKTTGGSINSSTEVSLGR